MVELWSQGILGGFAGSGSGMGEQQDQGDKLYDKLYDALHKPFPLLSRHKLKIRRSDGTVRERGLGKRLTTEKTRAGGAALSNRSRCLMLDPIGKT